MSEPLFSYGTLQLPRVQLALFDRLLTSTDDVLDGYRLVEVEVSDPQVVEASGIETHLALVPAADAAEPIHGKVLELTASELDVADLYETQHYRRVRVQLASGRHAWVYVKA